MKKDYVPPILIKSKKMDFPIAIINSSGKGIVCKLRKRFLLNLILVAVLIVAILPATTILPIVTSSQPVHAAPADAYWVKGSGTWADDDNHWATTSNGSPADGNLPDTTTNVHFDVNSFNASSKTVTITATAYCKAMDWTGATNSPTLAHVDQIVTYGNVTFIANMIHTGTARLLFSGNKNLTAGGIWSNPLTVYINGGGSCTLQDELNIGTQTITLNRGGFNTNNQTVTCGAFNSDNDWDGSPVVITFGTSVVNCVNWTVTPPDVSVAANTATINCSGNFAGGSITTYNVVNLTGATSTVSGSNTFATLNFINPTAAQAITLTAGTTQTVTGTFTGTGFGTADANRLDILTSSAGSSATINAATVAVTKADLKDLIGAGAGSWAMGAASDVRHVSGGSGITYRLYWVGGTGNWTTIGEWATVSGGTTAALVVPDSVTSAYFDANSFAGAGLTVTVDATASCLDIDWTGATNSPTLAHVNQIETYGDVTFIANMIHTGTARLQFSGNKNLTAGGIWSNPLTVYINGGGSCTLQDELNIGTQTITLNRGGFNTNNQTVTCGAFNSDNDWAGSPIVITFGTSVVNCVNWTVTPPDVSVAANTATINCSGNFAGGSLDYNGATLNLTGATSTVSGSNTFSQLNLNPSKAQVITFTDGTTQNVSTASLSGSAGIIHTLKGSSTGGWTINKLGGGTLENDYITLNYSAGTPANTWYYDNNSTIGAGVTTWYMKTYTLTTTSGDGGNVSTPGEGAYVYNRSVIASIVGTADGGYSFVNWTGDVTTVANVSNSSTTITMSANYSITANFTGGGAVLAISNTPSSKAFGIMLESTSYWSKGSAPTFPLDDAECYFSITNEGSTTINISINASNFTGGLGWVLTSGTPGSGEARMKAGKSGDANEGAMVIITTSPASFITSLAGGISKYWELKLETGIFTDGVIKESHITLVAVEDM